MKRPAISIIIAILLFLSLPVTLGSAKTYAAQPWFIHTFQTYSDVLKQSEQTQSIEKETYLFSNVLDSANAMNVILFGASEANAQSMLRSGAIAVADNFVAQLYQNPPASTYAFIQDMGQNLGFIRKPVFAQGIGFSGLSPLLGMWKAFRNIAYLILALIMVFVGFMIMFRKKIDPKTVVSVQNALPRIVVTLLLITFSYAIVGLMIDLMYLIMMVALSILTKASNGVLPQDTPIQYATGGFWFLMGRFIFGDNPQTLYLRMTSITQLLAGPGGFWSALKTVLLSPINAIVLLLLGLIILFGYIRVLFLLVSSYIQIIFSLLIGPFQLLMDAVPGGNGFSSWMKNLFINLIVFPITAIMMVVGTILVNMSTVAPSTSGLTVWTPPLLGTDGSNAKGLLGILSIGILLSIPSIVGSIKEGLKAKPAMQIGTIISPVVGSVTGGWNLAYQARMLGIWKGFGDKQSPTTSGNPEKPT